MRIPLRKQLILSVYYIYTPGTRTMLYIKKWDKKQKEGFEDRVNALLFYKYIVGAFQQGSKRAEAVIGRKAYP